jgi:hypothetical protein
LYQNLLGTNSTTAQRRSLYARYLAAETEFWRSHRQAAAVMHFTSLGYSRPNGQTSDHWLNVPKLEWEPEFHKYVPDAFAPIGVMIDDWAESYEAGKPHEFTLVLLNDESHDWTGKLRLRLLSGDKAVLEQKLKATIPALGRTTLKATIPLPANCGACQLEATLTVSGGDVRSLRDFSLVPAVTGSGRP